MLFVRGPDPTGKIAEQVQISHEHLHHSAVQLSIDLWLMR